MINAADAIVEHVYVKADALSKDKEPYDSQKLIELGYIRGLIAALYINEQISRERCMELNNEVQPVKISGSTFFSRTK